MSVTEVSGNQAAHSAAISEASNSEKTDKTVLQTIKEKLSAGKDYVLSHKRAFANIGQIGGTAALVVGGASLLFSGIAANLTIAGMPLGIPLMAAGGVLLAAGTIFQVAHHIEKGGSTIGEKVKGFFKETLANLTVGTIIGSSAAGAFMAISLQSLVTFVPVAIKLKTFFSSNARDAQAWENLKKDPPQNNADPALQKKFMESSSFEDFLEKVKGMLEPVDGVVKTFDQSTVDFFKNILEKLASKQETQKNTQNNIEETSRALSQSAA